MRVLYCWDTAGINSIINHYMGETYDDHEGTVVMRRSHDPHGIYAYYSPSPLGRGKWSGTGRALQFYLVATLRSPRRDILHVCANIGYTGLLRTFSMGGKVVLHYHGSDARNIPYASRKAAEERADCILVATPDLLEYEYAKEPVYLHNPVDTRLFAPLDDIPKNNRGLVFMAPDQNRKLTLQRLQDLGFGDVEWDLAARSHDTTEVGVVEQTISPRLRGINNIRYGDMPSVLSKYQYYAEIYYNAAAGSWYTMDTTTGLQAMSLGLNVVSPDGSVARELPPEHRPERVAKRVREIYDGLV
ncbi:MAG: hypothetical protein OXI27_01155 [Thaumarchaeota archaeon]|nr:hypothetical protein [Nitrososphaerota archaeon]